MEVRLSKTVGMRLVTKCSYGNSGRFSTSRMAGQVPRPNGPPEMGGRVGMAQLLPTAAVGVAYLTHCYGNFICDY